MIRITEQALRDGNQSLLASRMKIDDILPIAEALDKVGFYFLEAWSGSIFECSMRFLNEDPWERLRKLKEHLSRTPLKALIRAQNLFGYRIFSDAMVHQFVKYAMRNGCDGFTIMDSLNDLRNMEVPIRIAKKEGAVVTSCILYSNSPIYTLERFVKIAKALEGFGSDILSIQDSAGILSPRVTFELVSRLRAEIGIPISLHSHCNTGIALMSYLEGIRAGASIVETCISPLSGGVSLPATESVVVAFLGTEYDPRCDLKLLDEIRKYFIKLWDNYASFYDRSLFEIDMGGFIHKLPSGMLSHLKLQLRQLGAIDKYDAVLTEVPVVVKDLGYPPLATPSSQIVAAQAAMNVITGERYKIIPLEVKRYIKGMYGHPPGEISEELKVKALGKNWQLEIIEGRPSDLIVDEYEKAEEEAKKLGLIGKPEDVITYMMFPNIAKEFLGKKRFM